MPRTSFTLSTVFRTVARAVPDQEVLVWGDRRFSYAELDQRIDGVAHHLTAQGLGCHTPRDRLAGHESGQHHVGLYLHNCNEYLEALVGALRARAVPFNVNYRYVAEELLHLFLDAGTEALVFHSAFAPQVAQIRDRLPRLRVLIQVADDSGNALLPGAVPYGSIVDTSVPAVVPEPSGDDVYMLYTGGTTGMPKGVLWRQHDAYVSAMGGTPFGSSEPYRSYDQIAEAAAAGGGGMRLIMTAPFMHGAAQWSTFHMITQGGAIVLPRDATRLDWPDVLRTVERERVVSIPVVGDAMARPLAAELERGDYDLSGVFAVQNGGAPLSPAVRARLQEQLPHVLFVDTVGSSETGIQMSQVADGDAAEPGVFTPDADTTVLDDDLTRELSPGDGQGWLARHGLVPLGYLGDADKTARTFPVVDGKRYSVPGDRAIRLEDGRIQLLGRQSITINSGGEKIFAEEVERAVAAHPAIADVIVTGRPSERWGSEVVAIVELLEQHEVSDEELLVEAARHVARYKLPKAIIRVPQVQRSPSGKADYRWARDQATTPTPTT
ncbi:acyl-CoA synthetase [Saccharopolyspora rhizosphaerae]|uniref:Acyl-CoA synthetase n=1 Tax=Saccharopolyspora rhizosphaerae TaxID=2492662 RepID=A0A426JWI0_9PSEU|nr:acyl-CoA synthetase [Saccharopolyspora rhizosphaerae]RRO17535.1 acyl-CoA synthetase [Saccharopolyspora rhizosphaerae]